VRLSFCCVCGTNKDLEHHHFIPKVEGGSDDEDNIITFCATHHDFVHGWKRVNRRILQKIGIAKARSNPENDPFKGRKPSYNQELLVMVLDMLVADASITAIAKETGLSRQTIYRIQSDPEEALNSLERWNAPKAKKNRKRTRKAKSAAYKADIGEADNPTSTPNTATADFLREIYGRGG
jgi:transposase